MSRDDHHASVNAPDPLGELRGWIEEARSQGLPQPASAAFVTVGAEGRPSARTVTVKRVEDQTLVFSTALWTRKAREAHANPQVALLFHWPSLERQAHVTGEASLAERSLAEELFAERDLFHQLQTVVSRQGEPIDDLEPLRDRLRHLAEVQEAPPACPPDWGALRIRPNAIELWEEAEDRIHRRRLFSRDGDGWAVTLLSP
ncbi:MAG TPA: pyridoxal 5'-phosphate synthase [Solirubrobacterales bacterium]|jgi:pyridoxamine 5'-phosphate oxidase|nr:pyridoxal 5'-phosphate synthase [Solirubrobacterales bacterium]